MEKLPPELILNIVNCLNFRDLLSFSLVSYTCLAITNQHVILKRFNLKFSKELLREKSICKARNYLCVKLEVTKTLFKHEIPKRIRDNLFEFVEYLELVFPEDDFFSHPKYVENFFKLLKDMQNLKYLRWESIEEVCGPVLENYVNWNIGYDYQELLLYQMDHTNFNDFFKLFEKATHLRKLTVDCDCHLDQILWQPSLSNFLIAQKILRHLSLRWLELDDTFFREICKNLELSHFTLEYGYLPQHEYFCKFLVQQNLEYLRLSETKGLNDVILRSICYLRKLKHLEINICNGFEMTTSSIPQFYNLTNLKVLKVFNHPQLEKSSNFFSKITNPGTINQNLKELKLQYITLNSFQEMTENFPNLKILELKECNLTNFDLNIIFKNLRNLYNLNLDVSSSTISNDCTIDYSLVNLKHLSLINGHHLLKEEFVETILKNTPNLSNLHFEFCINLSNEWIKIAIQLKCLKNLKLSGFGGMQHPKLDIGFFKIIQDSNLKQFKLNFFLYSKFLENFNTLENMKIECE